MRLKYNAQNKLIADFGFPASADFVVLIIEDSKGQYTAHAMLKSADVPAETVMSLAKMDGSKRILAVPVKSKEIVVIAEHENVVQK